jgi:hypothetical protein
MINKTVLIAGGSSLLSAAAAAVAGYYIGVKKSNKKFDVELQEQLAAAERVFKMKHKVGMYENPMDLLKTNPNNHDVEKAAATQAAYSGFATSDEDLERIAEVLSRQDHVEPVSHRKSTLLDLEAEAEVDIRERNLFADAPDDEWPTFEEWAEMMPRGDRDPYVITHDEFHQTEVGYPTTSLTWFPDDGYSGNGVLLDEADNPIPQVDEVVGEANMERFGMWSGKENCIYICNPRLEMYMEINRVQGSYAEFIGMTVPVHKRRPPRRGESA